MQRRCTESACRRTFPIGPTAPVRCPHCGKAYPRIVPDFQASRQPDGYTVRLDFTHMTEAEMRQIFIQNGWRFRWLRPQLMIFGYNLSALDAYGHYRRFRRQGIPAEVIPYREAQRQRLPFAGH